MSFFHELKSLSNITSSPLLRLFRVAAKQCTREAFSGITFNAAFYQEAKEANKALVLGKRVKLEKYLTDRDRYGRLLRYVYVDGTFVNGELVRLGTARAKAYRPDEKYQEKLEALEREAVMAGRGMWSLERSKP